MKYAARPFADPEAWDATSSRIIGGRRDPLWRLHLTAADPKVTQP